MTIGIVIIGRNEGERFQNCIRSLQGRADRVVYVDSGSTDNSVSWAKEAGFQVETLPADRPFTAARARNAGYRRLVQQFPDTVFIQFMDGDCQLNAGWLDASLDFLKNHPEVAVAFGRRREQFPDATIYNAMCDLEWNTPIGERQECGGDCLIRRAAFDEAGGYRDDLIAGEEPEMCLRLREKGWRIWRLDAEMTPPRCRLCSVFPNGGNARFEQGTHSLRFLGGTGTHQRGSGNATFSGRFFGEARCQVLLLLPG